MQPGKSLERRIAKRFPDGIRGAGETGKGEQEEDKGFYTCRGRAGFRGTPVVDSWGVGGVMCRKELYPDVAQRFLLPQALGGEGMRF